VTEKRSKLVEANELAKKYYNYVFLKSKHAEKARQYLKNRKFSEETLNRFEIGYSTDNWTNFSDFAAKRGFSKKELIDSGLSIKSSRGKDEIYDRFRSRIMFPIKDLVGKTIGFGGRILDEENKTVTKTQSAKYINTPETKVYSKSKNIYGLFDTKNSIVEKDQVLIVEGYTDVMALHQVGVNNAVASLGTALTQEQIEIICRFTKNIVLVFDSDMAGIKASLRSIERLREYNQKLDLYNDSNIDMRVALLGADYDPADYVFKKGAELFMQVINSSKNILDFVMDMILIKYDLDNLNQKLRATDELMGFIATLSSKIVQEDCIRKISERLGLRESLLVEQLSRKISTRAKRRDLTYTRNTEKEPVIPARNLEIEALKILLNGVGDKLYDLLDIGPEYFKFDDTRRLYEIIRQEFDDLDNSDKKINFPLEISSNKLEGEEIKKLYNLIIFSPVNYSDFNLAEEEVYNNLKRLSINEKIDDIKSRLKKFENYKKQVEKLKKKLSEKGEIKIKGKDPGKSYSLKELISKEEKIDREIMGLFNKLSDLESEKRNFLNPM
jgi:DNA primase